MVDEVRILVFGTPGIDKPISNCIFPLIDEHFSRDSIIQMYFLYFIFSYLYIFHISRCTQKRRIAVLEIFYSILLLSSTLDAFRPCCHRQENEFFQACMPFYSLFSGQVTLMRSHGLKRVM